MQKDDPKKLSINYKDTLIDMTFPFVDSLLIKYGEFFPVAAAINKDGTISTVATYDGNERPLSDDVIKSLKNALIDGAIKGEYTASVIFYDVRAINPYTGEKGDAVAVWFENSDDSVGKRFFYPYVLSEKRELSYSEGWNNTIEKEIFVK
jgi:hypothetical protein